MYGKSAMEIAAKDLEKLIKAAETPTNLFDELAGEGRTTETVKGNADDLAAHQAESVYQSGGAHGFRVESGDWTPRLIGTAGGEATYVARTGKYILNGIIAHCQFSVEISAKNAISNIVSIVDLPFPISLMLGGSISKLSNLTLRPGYSEVSIVRVDNIIFLSQLGSGLPFAYTGAADISNNFLIEGRIIYKI